MFPAILLLCYLSPFCHTYPTLVRRDATSDNQLLNFLLSIEHMQAKFYRQGLIDFNAELFRNATLPKGVYDQFKTIGAEDQVHVDTLSAIITATGNTPVAECVYDFKYQTVEGFVNVARGLERTGVSAYDGLMADLTGKEIITAIATVATVEGRQASFVNAVCGLSPFPTPFDTPLGKRAIVSLLGGYVKSCPYDLGIAPYPALGLSVDHGKVGTSIDLTFPDATLQSQAIYCTFVYGASQDIVQINKNSCTIPPNAVGDLYVFATNSKNLLKLNEDTYIVAGPAVFVVNSSNDKSMNSSSKNGW